MTLDKNYNMCTQRHLSVWVHTYTKFPVSSPTQTMWVHRNCSGSKFAKSDDPILTHRLPQSCFRPPIFLHPKSYKNNTYAKYYLALWFNF